MPRARLADVAAQAGVSTATASLVLREQPGPSEATRVAVRDAATALGYRADRSASALARKRSHLVGVVLDVSHPFHAALVDAFDHALAAADLDLVLAATTSRRDERAAVNTLLDSRCAAIAILGPTLSATTLDALATECPLVLLGRSGTRHAPGVWADDALGLRLAVDHLADLGHERIAHAPGPRGVIATARTRGYRQAMRARGLAHHLKVLERAAGGTADPASITRLLSDPESERASAVVAFNDLIALGLRDAMLREKVGVPEHLSIVGYDDSPLAAVASVRLTSVSQQPALMAPASVRTIELMLDGATEVADVVVQPRLVVRDSSGPPPR